MIRALKPVWYLCTNEFGSGLSLARDLEENFYSPGIFVVHAQPILEFAYWFPAFHSDELIISQLVSLRNGAYSVRIDGVGRFDFRPQKVHYRYNNYHGNDPQLSQPGDFWRMIPEDDLVLEHACRYEKFYFVGFGGQRDWWEKGTATQWYPPQPPFQHGLFDDRIRSTHRK